MLICNNCGNPLENTQTFCGSCGTPNPLAHRAQPAAISPPAPVYHQPPPPAPPPYINPGSSPSPASTQSLNSSSLLVGLVGLVAVAAIAVAVYFALANSTKPTATASVSPDALAESLQSAIKGGNLVSPSGSGDAYSYYQELKKLDPNHSVLLSTPERVRSQLNTLGDQIFTQKESVGVEKLTDQDWYKTERLYGWLRELESGNKKHEARLKFAQGEIAKASKNASDAEARFSEAAQLDPGWALAQNSLGLVRVDMRKDKQRWIDAIPFYQRAIDLQSDWVIPYNNMGTAYFFQGETNPASYTTAEYWYKQAIDKNPNWGRPYYWLGRIAEKRGSDYDAVTYYEKALNLDSNGYVFKSEERAQMQAKINSRHDR